MSNFFKQSKNIIIIILKTSSLLFVIAYVAWCGFEYYWFRGFIPEKIGVTFPVSISGETGFFKGCGAAIFLFKRSTVDANRQDGVFFFEAARKKGSYYSTKYENEILVIPSRN